MIHQRRAIVGATARQLAELDQLFPHAGQQQGSLIPGARGGAQRTGNHLLNDNRQPQIRTVRAPYVDRDTHDRRQIVGAYAEEAEGGEAEWKELGLPLSGVSGVSIVAAASQDFELKPNRLFLPGILALADTLAANLLMTALSIGGHNCLLSTGAIPMTVFSHLALYKPFRGWAASNAQPITFTIKNIHATVTQVVYGVWFGLAQDT
jgi:hypothetical protein